MKIKNNLDKSVYIEEHRLSPNSILEADLPEETLERIKSIEGLEVIE